MIRRTVAIAALSLSTLVLALGLAHAYTPPAASATPTPAMKAKVDSAQKAYAIAEAQLKAGTGTVDTVYAWSKRWAEAQRATGVATAVADHLKRMQALETLVKTKVGAGLLNAIETNATAYYVAEAETM